MSRSVERRRGDGGGDKEPPIRADGVGKHLPASRGPGERGLDGRLRASVYEQFLRGDDEQAIDRLNEYAAVGLTHFIVIYRPPYDFKRIERLLTKVAPRASATG